MRRPASSLSTGLALAILCGLCSTGGSVVAAANDRPTDLSRADVTPLDQLPVHTLPAVDVEALVAEDAVADRLSDTPYRVGQAMATHLAPARDGTWEELPGEGQLWRLIVRSPGARWLVAGFDDYRLQSGASLYVHDGTADGVVLGPFTSADIRSHGELWFPPIPGDRVVFELIWPESLRGQIPRLHLGTVSHGYKSWDGAVDPMNPGDLQDDPELLAGACNIDVNCPLGDEWQDEKRGVTRILIGGSGLCTGSLIGTTAADCRPYFLTAAHCLSSQSAAASTTFLFNYERPGCESGVAPTGQTVTGSSLLATWSPSDMTLLELNQSPPENFAPYFNGWNRSPVASPDSTCIHHPSGDEKKISYNDDPLINGSSWGSDHWRVTEWEEGTTEGGSSGSPLFDVNSRIVGQLHGGQASCSNITWDEYGKLDVSWTGGGSPSTRLSDWLDPTGNGAMTVDGIDYQFCLTPQAVLEVAGQTMDDKSGNLDGIADPGESVELQVMLRNNGNLGATAVGGMLTSSTPLAVVADNPASWPDIATDGQAFSLAPHFSIQFDPAYPCGQPVSLQLTASALELTGANVSNLSLPTGFANILEHYRDEMENGTGGWSSQSLIGSESWSQVTSDSFSPSHSWFIRDINLRRDTALRAPVLDALPAASVLRFAQRYSLSNNQDGGVLEYSIDGGSNWLDAGGLITSGGYDGAIPGGATSALSGRPVWTGDSGGWQVVSVDLGPLAGEDLHLRWRLGTDLFTVNEGWYVDDVIVDTTDFLCQPLAQVPGEPAAGANGLRVEPDPSGFRLSWDAPADGGAAMGYRLYRLPLGDPLGAPACEADLGSNTGAVVSSLPDGHGFLIVGVNSLGEGSYGTDSAGTERTPAQGAAVCP